MKLELNLGSITTKLRPAIDALRKYSVALVLLIIAGVFGFLIWRIGVLANAEPSADAVEEKLMEIKRAKINPDDIEVIEDLKARNIDLETYFSGRDNPFQE